MAVYLGIDTSNYTTSTALFDSDAWAQGGLAVKMEKKLLPTAPGALGLRQSDAVFAHVQQLGGLAGQLFGKEPPTLDGVGVSIFPRRVEGSYMPCFLVGQMGHSWCLPRWECRCTPFPIRRDISRRHCIQPDGWT